MPIELLDDLIGKPYTLGGRGPDSYDCFGLVLIVLKRLGIDIPDAISYTDPQDNHNALMAEEANYLSLPRPEFGCIVLLAVSCGIAAHIGIVLEYPYFIHAMEKRGVVIERLTSPFWKTRIKGYYK